MRQSTSFKIILTSMFAAMVCVSTICIQIASPMGGYINLGDALVLISAYLLGPIYGTAAAGIGSALADLITGYAYYAPGTLIIKGGIALIASLLVKFRLNGLSHRRLRLTIAAIPGEIFMVLGYLVYAWFCLGYGPGAVASVPGNIAQAIAGIAIAAILTPLIEKPREIQEMLAPFHKK